MRIEHDTWKRGPRLIDIPTGNVSAEYSKWILGTRLLFASGNKFDETIEALKLIQETGMRWSIMPISVPVPEIYLEDDPDPYCGISDIRKLTSLLKNLKEKNMAE